MKKKRKKERKINKRRSSCKETKKEKRKEEWLWSQEGRKKRKNVNALLVPIS